MIRDNMDLYDQTCRMMCAGANCIVIAVDFRLSPEHPFPAAPNDCYAATCWVAEHANELNIDANKLGVWGESCGGNLATVVAMRARDKDGPALAAQIIVTPMLEYDFSTRSYQENGQAEYLLTTDTMQWFWDHYLPNESDRNNPYCTPCTAKNLKHLPPALIVTAEYDPLRDEGKKYAQQLQAADVKIDYQCYNGLIHGFFDLYSISAAADTACKKIIKRTRLLLSSHP